MSAPRRPAGISAGTQVPSERIADIQRSRLMTGAVSAIQEFGYSHATVAQITARARVSRRTFYELFGNREECLAALLEHVVISIEGDLDVAGLGDLPWHERVRGGLLAILAFFDREPALARVCVVETMRGGPRVLERREQILARLATALDAGRAQSVRAAGCTPLTAEALVGAAFGVVHARLLRGKREPLTGLLGELMGIIVLPYLGPGAARREQARPVAVATVGAAGVASGPHGERDPLRDVPMRLTYRTTRVLECIAAQPGVSNRLVAEQAGITDQGQISKLLARLERLGLIANLGVGHAKGEPNAWHLTQLGEGVAQQLVPGTHHREAVA
jgi:AcrR family transcriptional regulator